jgi:Transposase
VKHTRWALLKDPDALKDSQLAVLDQLRRERSVLYRCWQLKEGLRDLFRLARPSDAPTHLDWWLAWACRSRIPAFVALSATVRVNRVRILAAVELGLSNSKLEGLNRKIRLIKSPRLRPPFRRRLDRDDLPLLRRCHRRPSAQMSAAITHGNPWRTIFRMPIAHWVLKDDSASGSVMVIGLAVGIGLMADLQQGILLVYHRVRAMASLSATCSSSQAGRSHL